MAELENLSKKILDDANRDAEALKSEAKSRAESIIKKSREEAENLLVEAKSISESLYKESLEKRISQNNALRRQELLSKKLELVEQILKKAREEAVKIDKEVYREYFKKNASSVKVTEGEFLIGSKENLVDASFVKQIFKPAKLSESKESADFEYGIKVISGRTHYTLSLLSDIDYTKEKLLALINRELFGGENK
ncbi:MAG: V-type ATP synthase subunit E [bacterium]|nr:V-type ATP synthase subunit E [bacterium]